MAAFTRTLLTAALLGLAGATSSGEASGLRMNPIRRVVDLLTQMQTKVTEEGKAEKKTFEAFMCWCTTGSGDLKLAISTAGTKITQLTSSLKEEIALNEQLASELATHKADRADAKKALAEATALREKEAATYAKDSSDDKTNIDALTKAIAAIEKGVAGSFLQTTAASKLRQLSISVDMSSVDRDVISSFLSQSAGYVPQSGQIIGILKQMKDTIEKDLADITAAEESAIKDYEELAAAKTKEIEANSAAIESKLERKGQVELEIVAVKEDLDDTQKSLAADTGFLADLEKSCSTKEAEWEVRSKTRTEELLALADTIKILNDDDALELFKKTLPTPALLQTAVSSKEVRKQALQALKGKAHKDSRLEFIALALRGGSKDFTKVIGMIDAMVTLLGKEQKSDDEKKAWCLKELDTAEDEAKVLDQTVADLEKAIAEANEMIATLKDEIEALEDGIKALDKAVMEATETRKTEHTTYVETMAADSAAKDLIGVAKNRLAKFYTPKLYKAAPKIELTAEERVSVSMGGTLAPTAPPGGIAGTGVSFFQQKPVALVQVASHDQKGEVAPPPPPETWGAYANKGEEHTGVVSMLDMLVADLDKEIQEMTVDEKDAQAEYETFMEDSAAKRATDAKSIADKEGAKADLEAEVEKLTAELKSTKMAAMDKYEYIKDLHLDCDWLLANFEARKAARAGEVESLKNAKAVLSGADYSLVQRSSTRLRGAASP
jgi:predicted metal-binding transcription factor (methanogenesis marker protein 9)/predicted  nucleic acid-binding Zn-ribbon protein